MDREDPLTIVIFADILLSPNGVRTFCKTLLDWSRPIDGLEVVVVSPSRTDHDDALGDSGVIGIRPQLQLPNPFYSDLILGHYGQAKLRQLVQSLPGSKVIHIATCGLLGASAAKLARRMNIPSVGCYHVDTRGQCVEPYFRLRGRLAGAVARFLDKRAYGDCLAMCAPSATAAEAANRSFFEGDVEVIPNAIDVERFHPGKDRQGAFRDKYCSNGQVLAVVIGRVAREKNVHLVCEHLARDKRISTVFVGDGPCGDELRRRWGVKVTGFLHGEDLIAAYQQADVFVQLSVLETFGLTLAESMACGLPAVVLRSGGLAGTIEPGNGVQVIDEHELPELADRCVKLVADESYHRGSALAARAFAKRLAPDVLLPRFVEMHRRVAR